MGHGGNQRAVHLYDSVPFLDTSLDCCTTWSDILYQLDSLSTHCEAETQLVLLHDHTSVHKSSACNVRNDFCRWRSLLWGRGFTLRVPNCQTVDPVQRGGGLAETHVCSLYRHSSASWCGIQSCHWAAFVITTMISVSSSTFSPYNEEPFCCALIRSPRYRAAGLDQTQCSSCFTPVAPVLGSVGFKGKCC